MESGSSLHRVSLPSSSTCKLQSWNVQPGERVRRGKALCSYTTEVVGVGETEGGGGRGEGGGEERLHLKSSVVGIVKEVLVAAGESVHPGMAVMVIEERCDHSTIVFDMCADCGMDLRRHPNTRGVLSQPVEASVSMVHGIPELRISQKEAEVLGHRDKLRLLEKHKLALVVDLDQTLIHTSVDPYIEPGLPDVFRFGLEGHPMLYHCRLRPFARQFLEKVSKLYEMHVFTMGTKEYAANIVKFLDPGKKLFCDRIITRYEFFDPRSKALRLKSVFPCGDSMVAIIDDREDVWGRCPNLIHVKPYIFFAGTEDINAPPPSSAPTTPTPTTPTVPQPFGVHRHPSVPAFPPDCQPFKTRHISSRASDSWHRTQQRSHNHHQARRTVSVDSRPFQRGKFSRGAETNGSEKLTVLESLLLSPPSEGTVAEEGTEVDTQTREAQTQGGDPSKQQNSVTQPPVNDNSKTDDPTLSVEVDGKDAELMEESGAGELVDDSKVVEGGDGKDGQPMEGVDPKDVEEEGKGMEKERDTSSSSSSSSDSEDSSSSSGIDDTLFESLGGEEGEEGEPRIEDRGQEPKEPEERVAMEEEKTCSSRADEEGEQIGPGKRIRDEAESKKTKSQEKEVSRDEPSPQEQQSREIESNSKSDEDSTVHKDLQDNTVPRRQPPEIQDPDIFLKHLGDILERLHGKFYTQYDQMQRASQSDDSTPTPSGAPTPDLKELIPQMRQSVLKGTKILFTGVVPTNMPPERCAEWNTARAFGASIHDRLVPGLSSADPKKAMRATTHVVAAKEGTSKLREARKIPGIKIVNPRWLWSCAETWTLVDERLHPVQGEKPDSLTSRGLKRAQRRPRNSEPRKKQARLDDKEAIAARDQVEHDVETAPEQASTSTDNGDDIFYDPELQEDNLESAEDSAEKLTRHLSIETRLSVSEDELERMEAEVDAELVSSSSSSDEDNDKAELGGLVGEREEDSEPSYEQFTGEESTEKPSRLTRKRKHLDVEESSSSASPTSSPMIIASREQSEDERNSSEEEEESGDELAELLVGNDDDEWS